MKRFPLYLIALSLVLLGILTGPREPAQVLAAQTGTEAAAVPTDLSGAAPALSKSSYTYTGSACTPTVTVSLTTVTGTRVLTPDVDYTLTYANNINAGTATVTVTGIGSYTGTAAATYTILPKDLSKAKLTLSKTSYTYNGKAKTPSVTVPAQNGTKLVEDTDYTVTYADNIDAGKASVTVAFAGNYSGTVTKTYTIAKKDVSALKIALEETEYTYDGEAKKPDATVTYSSYTLSNPEDYKLGYYDNKKPGIATLRIRGTGNYTGTKDKTFRILPATPTLQTAANSGKSIELTWDVDSLATGYAVYRKNSSGDWKLLKKLSGKSRNTYTDASTGDYGSKYTYAIRTYVKVTYDGKAKYLYSDYSNSKTQTVQAGLATLTRVMPLSRSSFKLTWGKVDNADGYVLYRKDPGTKKSHKIKTITSGGRTYYTDPGLTYGKTYTYYIRTYRKSGSETVLGAYDKSGYSAKLSWTSKYSGGYKYYYDAAGEKITDVDGIIGKQSSYYLKVNKDMNVLTIYAKDGDKGYTIPVKAALTSTGGAGTPVGEFGTMAKYRWHTLNHNVEGQWCTRIVSDVLFHSVWYRTRNNKDLSTIQYNRLGTTASMGCVRVNCETAKWIYDNCSLGTKVKIYTGSDPGAFGKPEKLPDLPSWHTWDPTDPNMQDLCREKGCH